MTGDPSWLARFAEFDTGVANADRYFVGLKQGSATLGLYRPEGTDPQGPHKRDEIYIVRQGTASLRRAAEVVALAAGDSAFVPAGMEHRFEQISADFDAWVFFWGPDGGEAA